MMGIPSKFALSGKNSARTGRTQLCFLIIGFTREAIRLRICSALSALCLSLRCENVCTKISGIGVVEFRAKLYNNNLKVIDGGGS